MSNRKCDRTKPWLMAALCWFVSAAASAQAAAASGKAAPEQPIPVVEVAGSLDEREEKSYRDILAGMDVFEKNRGLAPGASLRLKVVPRQDGVSMDGLVLQIVGEHTNIAVPVAADHTFVLPRNADAANDRAVVRFNRKAKSLAWRADIRSAGVPPKARRLGDLLLECQVGLAGDLIAYVHHPINIMVTKLADPCGTLPINIYNFADRPVFSITLIDGQRRGAMPAAMLHGPTAPMLPSQEDWILLRERVFMVKFKLLYEKGWTHDTLLQFDYMDDDATDAIRSTEPTAGAP